MSEYSNKKTRGAFVAAVFAMQGFGILAGDIFAIIISTALKNRFDAPPYEVDPVGSTVPKRDYILERIFEAQIYVYGPIALKAFYLPWAMLALDVIYG
ncbi:unnamed protein product [Sphenostylis stenocarpa]|uniref:Uncharacterized protein n=1 Tax=Sphenostylis stenocarpa TaxID=92480 RepID=A0AA86VSN7_9FABA|nr:unnamed protein product [Sphenostylis stenocarpa]